MDNRIKYLTILLILLWLPLTAWGATYKVEINGINYSISDNYVTVIAKSDGTKYSGNIIIPEEIEYNSNTYTVKSLGGAFNGCDELLSLQLPNTIESIGSFSGCSNLKEFFVPDPVTSIPESAFKDCSSLETIGLSPQITSIGKNAFVGCEKLKSVHIYDLVAWCNLAFSHVGTGSWSGYKYVTDYNNNPLSNGADLYLNGEKVVNLVIPESVSIIPRFAFRGCSSFETITISDKTNIHPNSFEGCKNLKILYSYAKSMSDQSFSGCTSLSIAYLYNTIGAYDTFQGCTNLETVLLPKSIVESDQYYSSDQREYLYKMFPNVKEYILQDGITKIGKSKFIDCSTVERINIPSTVKLMCNMAFARCSKLKQIYIEDLQAWCGITYGQNNSDPGGGKDADPTEANPLHKGGDLYLNGAKLVNCVIPDQVTQLNCAAFYGCNSIESLTIQSNVGKIDNYAFYGCKSLSHVLLPDNQIVFGYEVFYNCDQLVSAGPLKSNCSIEFGWETKIPSWALLDISNLQTVIIPSTIGTIGENAFRKANYGEKAIENIYINATTPPSISSNTFSKYDATLFVPIDCKDVYSNALYWKNFNIIELVDIESIEINKEQYDIIVGESTEINVTILPEKATYKDLYWSVEDPQVARIDNGVVLGLKTGTTRVTAKTTDGTDLSATCLVNVTNPVKLVTLSKNLMELEAEESETITATCTPSDADDISISWISKNNNIATVNNGKIEAISVGETEIVAKSVSGVEATCKVVVNPTIATSLKLNKKSLSLTTGNSEKLEAIILPTKTTNKEVKWESSNPEIVSVDNTGVVRALSNGTAKISASTTDGSNLGDECVVTATTLATSISLNQNNANLIVGQSLSLDATILPSTTSNKNISWKSNNSNCASVSSEGIVYANATGTATVTATTTDGTNLSASCVFVVTNPVISVTLDKTSAELMVGQQLTITASCIPSNADNTTITWSSSDNTVATVVNGIVTAKKLGDAIITASSANGIEAKCSINVVPTPISSLVLSESTISIVKNQTFELSCTIYPDDATSKELIWSSDNENIAKVDESGVVTGISTGETTIIVKAKSNSKISATCSVIVTTPVTSIKLDQDRIEIFVEDEIQLKAICSPEDADNNNVRWISSDTNIAEVSNNGYVKAKNEGNMRITATTTDGTNLSATCDITVKKIQQSITWNDELLLLQEGGEMIMLGATSSSGLPVKFISNDDNVVSIFDLGDVIYANPVKCGTAIITSYQEGNYKYEAIESKKTIEVVEAPRSATKTLIAYYSQSVLIDGIVSELANQIASSNASVYIQKIEPTNDRINNANTDIEVRDSVMNIILHYPNEASSYPEIKNIHVNINDYDNIIMVYPLWNVLMAAPMQTFRFYYNDILEKKSNAYIEYDLFDEADSSSNAKVLRFNSSNIEDMSNVIEDWLNNSEATGIMQLRKDRDGTAEGHYDLQGRRVTTVGDHGLYIIKGKKIIK